MAPDQPPSDDPERSPRPLTRLRAGRETGDDLLSAVALVVIGTILPVLALGRYESHLALYLSPSQSVAIAALGYGLASWLLVEALEIDRVTFLGATLIAPWVVVIAMLIGAPLLPGIGTGWIETIAFRDSLFQYPIAIAFVGAAVVACSLLAEQLSIRHPQVPGRRRVTFAAGGAALLGVGIVSGTQYLRPPAASIEDVELRYRADVEVNVWLEAESTDFHVAVTAPDGTETRRRIREFELEHGPTRLRMAHPDGDVYRGRFEIRLVSALGKTIDSTSVTVEEGPTVSILDIEAESSADGDTIDVTATVENDGDVPVQLQADLFGVTDPDPDADLEWGDRLASEDVWVSPGESVTIDLMVARADVPPDVETLAVGIDGPGGLSAREQVAIDEA